MKDILSKKKKFTDIETISLTEGCSAVLTNKLPPKLKDPRSFTVTPQTRPISFDQIWYATG
ncbi:putative WD repeat-containing protein C2A9.03-like [Gossypium australe]|uniref:Putative WD repeat-containing protein C2A9.03-like n=1 Tax=Gossypium australe TaxID=47621 RepID=A0A5B6TY97_9ROSI|nr:putative WD repeat-containing protein C2A9.03-like [Gossypium australe]